MKNNKVVFILIGIVVVLLIVIGAVTSIFLVSRQSSDSENKKEETNNESSSDQTKEKEEERKTSTVADNYVKCQIDNQQVDFKMLSVSYFKSMNTTTFLASGIDGTGGSMQLSFPGQKTGTFKDSATSSELGISYGTNGTESYSSFFEYGQCTINVTKYEGNTIEGDFNGPVIYLDANGTNPQKRHAVSCSFKSNVVIKTI